MNQSNSIDQLKPMDMFLKDVPWETRNLGRASFAVTNEWIASSKLSVAQSYLDQLKAQGSPFFAQARVPLERHEAVIKLSSLGFYPVETTLEPSTDLSSNITLAEYKNDPQSFLRDGFISSDFVFSEADRNNESDILTLKSMVKSAFEYDRFHVDANCLLSIADQRFVYWVDDLVANPNVVIRLLRYKSMPCGFFLTQAGSLILIGVAKDYHHKGIGPTLVLGCLSQMQDDGIVSASTVVSSNNVPVVNLLIRIGFQMHNPMFCMHYWSD